jgi:dihydroorotate dehydrogenase (fumarate)
MSEQSKPAASLGIDFCGIPLQSPFILSSGPSAFGSEGMIRATQLGCGAVVTKTIRIQRAINPVRHIGKISETTLINAEKWADSDRLVWYEKEIPEAVRAGAVVIGSVGHTPGEAKAIVEDVERAGAQMIELVSYTEETLLPMLDYAKAHVSVPVLCKLSGNWPNAAETAAKCAEHGADGFAAIDSIGPVLSIDIENRRPQMYSDDGFGWMSGGAIKPISLRINAQIAQNARVNKPVYGIGGVLGARDAVEYLMVGCRAVGICSVAILKGLPYIQKMTGELAELLPKLGFSSVEEAIGAALENFPKQELVTGLDFRYDAERCSRCERCVRACPYSARTLDFPNMSVDASLCRGCGVCADLCARGALTAVVLPQDAAHQILARESAEFYESVQALNR